MLVLIISALLRLGIGSAAAQDLQFNYVPAPKAKENPAFIITPSRAIDELYVQITVGGKTLEFTRKKLAAGSTQRFEWPRDTAVTHADCYVLARFAEGDVSEINVPIDYRYEVPLKVDLSKASADISARTVTVHVTAPVDSADIIAYGAHKSELDRSSISLSGGPGPVVVPFVGDPGEVVLLDVTLKAGGSWSGFTYSPWFLDIPHDDVRFESNSAEIPSTEVYKLEATLRELQDVVDKYGSVVPVKLYVAGCTDTVGDASHNLDLSGRRARAIATWLKNHGFSHPIYTYGFGEALLAVPTGDQVDHAANRRVLYMVGSNPPPAGSGVPQVSWRAM